MKLLFYKTAFVFLIQSFGTGKGQDVLQRVCSYKFKCVGIFSKTEQDNPPRIRDVCYVLSCFGFSYKVSCPRPTREQTIAAI